MFLLDWRQDAAITGTLAARRAGAALWRAAKAESVPPTVEAGILPASERGFQPPVPIVVMGFSG